MYKSAQHLQKNYSQPVRDYLPLTGGKNIPLEFFCCASSATESVGVYPLWRTPPRLRTMPAKKTQKTHYKVRIPAAVSEVVLGYRTVLLRSGRRRMTNSWWHLRVCRVCSFPTRTERRSSRSDTEGCAILSCSLFWPCSSPSPSLGSHAHVCLTDRAGPGYRPRWAPAGRAEGDDALQKAHG